MTYMLFWTDTDRSHYYTTEHGEPCSLEDHLRYLRQWGGTPDMFCSFDSIVDAVEAARTETAPLALVSERDYKIIEIITPETD